MSTATKAVFILGLLFLTYGYLCRLLSIYFFWDSKYFGWIGVMSAFLLLLIDIRIARVKRRENIFFVRFFVALIVIFLATEASAVVWIKSSKFYDEVTEGIKTDEVIKAEIGDVRGFGLLPGVNIVDIIKMPSSETMSFVITVRGVRTYKEMEVTIGMIGPLEWRVLSTKEI